MEHWRLLPVDRKHNSFMKMAVDEAILHFVGKKGYPNTLRFYSMSRPAVSVGYFQAVEKEVDVALCQKSDVEIFRRMTGGGAVYKNPETETNYSVVINEKNLPAGILPSYRKICNAVAVGLSGLGCDAEYQLINDIVLNSKKISGSAQTRKFGAVLQHGTVLLDVDTNKMFSYLKVSDEKIKDKMISSVHDRVTSLKKECGKDFTFEQVEESIKKGFEEAFDVTFEKSELTKEEKGLAEDLFKNKYSQKSWNFWR